MPYALGSHRDGILVDLPLKHAVDVLLSEPRHLATPESCADLLDPFSCRAVGIEPVNHDEIGASRPAGRSRTRLHSTAPLV